MRSPATVLEVDPVGQHLALEVTCEACGERLRVSFDLELSTMVAGPSRSLLAAHIYGAPDTAGRRTLARHETVCRATTTHTTGRTTPA